MSTDIPDGLRVEKVYLVEARYTPEAAERRPAVRAQHLAHAAELKRAGTIVEVGAYSDALTSSILLMRVADEAAATAIANADIYKESGVWGEITVRPFGRLVLDDD